MKKYYRHILISAVVIISLLALNSLSNNSIRPDISFTDIDGQQHSLNQYDGKPILVTFWATDCPGCIKEMPDLIALHNKYSSKGLTMIDVAMSHDKPAHIKAMQAEKKLPFIITWDKTNQIAQEFDNVRVTPTHFLIAPNGQIVMRKLGEINLALLHDKLDAMGL
jgi:peroxiredoxin